MADTTIRAVGNLEFALYDLRAIFNRYGKDPVIERFVVRREELENVRVSVEEALKLLVDDARG